MTKNFTGKSNTLHLIHNEKQYVFKAEHLYTGSSHQAESFLLPRFSVALPKGPRKSIYLFICHVRGIYCMWKIRLYCHLLKPSWRAGMGREEHTFLAPHSLSLCWNELWTKAVSHDLRWVRQNPGWHAQDRQGHLQRGLRHMVAIAGTYSHSSASFPASSIDNLCSTWSKTCAQI